jgi:hypothetical protein
VDLPVSATFDVSGREPGKVSADVVGPEREDDGRGGSNGGGGASANSDLRALVAQARELLFARQVEQALAVSDRLLRLVEPGTDPGSLEAAALLEHARSLMYLDYRDSHARRWIRPAVAIYCRIQRFSTRCRATPISVAAAPGSSGLSNPWRRLRGELSREQRRYEQAASVLQRGIDTLALGQGADSVLLAQAHFLHLQADGMLGAPVRLSDVRGSSAGPETDLALEREAAIVRSWGGSANQAGAAWADLYRALVPKDNTDLAQRADGFARFIDAHQDTPIRSVRFVVGAVKAFRWIDDLRLRAWR